MKLPAVTELSKVIGRQQRLLRDNLFNYRSYQFSLNQIFRRRCHDIFRFQLNQNYSNQLFYLKYINFTRNLFQQALQYKELYLDLNYTFPGVYIYKLSSYTSENCHSMSFNSKKLSKHSQQDPNPSKPEDEIFQSQERNFQQESSHLNEQNLKCKSQQILMENRIDSQSGQDDYYCMTCNQNFNICISQCHPRRPQEPKFKCDISRCNKIFNIEYLLERHKLVHSGQKPYECDYENCQQKFNQKSNLNRHKRIHSKQKPFICQKCCKSFTTTTNLKQHVQVHLQDKQKRKKYVCQIKGCDKQYLYMCNLKKHKLQHQDPQGNIGLSTQNPVNPSFSFNIDQCKFKILYKSTKEQHQFSITYRQAKNGIIYKPQLFSKIVEEINQQIKIQEPDNSQRFLSEIEDVLSKLIVQKANLTNVCFEMHDDLKGIANLLIKAAMNIVRTLGCKMFAIIINSYSTFKDTVQNLLFDIEPRE